MLPFARACFMLYRKKQTNIFLSYHCIVREQAMAIICMSYHENASIRHRDMRNVIARSGNNNNLIFYVVSQWASNIDYIFYIVLRGSKQRQPKNCTSQDASANCKGMTMKGLPCNNQIVICCQVQEATTLSISLMSYCKRSDNFLWCCKKQLSCKEHATTMSKQS